MNGRRLLVLACLLGAIVLTGCESKQARAQRFYKQAITSRSTTATEMTAAWRKNEILLDDCLNLAFDHLERDHDAASIAFAGAVLDFAGDIQRELPQGDEFLLMWFRIGGLAGAAATTAYNLSDFPAARSLVLAGPKKWQSDAFWERHPNHDALVGRVMFLSGEEGEALRWLRRNGEMDGEVKAAHAEIMAAIGQRGAGAGGK